MIWLILLGIIVGAGYLLYKQASLKTKNNETEKYIPRPKIPGTFKGVAPSRTPIIPQHTQKNNSDGVIRIVGRLEKDANDSYEYDIVGESFCQDALLNIIGLKTRESIEVKKTAVVVRDLKNNYDKNAVAVYIENQRVGYLPKEDALDFCEAIKGRGFDKTNAFDVEAMIVGGWSREGDEGKFGVKLNIDVGIGPVEFRRY